MLEGIFLEERLTEATAVPATAIGVSPMPDFLLRYVFALVVLFGAPITGWAQDQAIRLKVQARTSDFFYAPVAQGVAVEARYLTAGLHPMNPGVLVGSGITDAAGQLELELDFPDSAGALPYSGELRIHSRWEDVVYEPVLLDLKPPDFPQEVFLTIPDYHLLDVVFDAGRAVSEDFELKPGFLRLDAVGATPPIYRFGFSDLRGDSAQFERIEDDAAGLARWECQISIPYAGDYLIKATTPWGEVTIPEIHLDPAEFPAPLILRLPPEATLEPPVEGPEPSWLSLEYGEGVANPRDTKVVLWRDRSDGNLAWPNEVRAQEEVQGIERWPLMPGSSYRLAVWGPDVPLYEMAWQQPADDQDLTLTIPTADLLMGRIGLRHRPSFVRHEVLSPRLGIRLASWFALKHDTNAHPFPPGEYRVVSIGQSFYDCGGNIREPRTVYAESEETIQVLAGKTSFAEGKPPQAGWIRIQVTAEGDPDPNLMDLSRMPLPEGVALHPYHFGGKNACMILHAKESDAITALTFSPRRNFSLPLGLLLPGDNELAHEVFPPGDYTLEVRVPGYPKQWIDLSIQARRATIVLVHVIEK